MRRQTSSALMVAERALPVSSDISPKKRPADMYVTWAEPARVSAQGEGEGEGEGEEEGEEGEEDKRKRNTEKEEKRKRGREEEEERAAPTRAAAASAIPATRASTRATRATTAAATAKAAAHVTERRAHRVRDARDIDADGAGDNNVHGLVVLLDALLDDRVALLEREQLAALAQNRQRLLLPPTRARQPISSDVITRHPMS
eukprot:945267-Rhodomonas_salina.2